MAVEQASRSALIVGSFVGGASPSRYVGAAVGNQLSAAGWKVSTVSQKTSPLRRMCDMLATTYRARNEYDVAVVEVYSGRAFYWAEAVTWLLRRLKKPYLLALHGGNLPGFARMHPARVTRLLKSVPVVVSPSSYLIQQLEWIRPDVRLLPNPISLERYPFRLRQPLRPSLIWLRAFHAIYNPSLLPDVVAQLQDVLCDVHATMVGPDKGDGSLQATQTRTTDLGLPDRFRFVSGVAHEEVGRYLDAADVFVNTTNFDNTPVSVLEAMACGLPVVSTNVGGLPYLLRNEETALLVPPANVEAMAKAIQRLFKEPKLAEHLVVNARRMVERFDWSIILPQWESVLQEVLQASRPCPDMGLST